MPWMRSQQTTPRIATRQRRGGVSCCTWLLLSTFPPSTATATVCYHLETVVGSHDAQRVLPRNCSVTCLRSTTTCRTRKKVETMFAKKQSDFRFNDSFVGITTTYVRRCICTPRCFVGCSALSVTRRFVHGAAAALSAVYDGIFPHPHFPTSPRCIC